MKKLHYIFGLLAVAVLVLSTASPAKANGVDPSFIIMAAQPNGDTSISGSTFSFTSTNATGTDCNFTAGASPLDDESPCFLDNQNTGGLTWTDMTFSITSPSAIGTISCDMTTAATAFSSCSVTGGGTSDTATIMLTGGAGVPFNNTSELDISGWQAGTTFDATISFTTTTPEPGSLALMLTGGGALLACLRRRRNSERS